MDSTRRTSIGNCDDNVYKYGFFIKSPPPQLFNNQSSWKRRYFILSHSAQNGYILSYRKGQQTKGHIEINEASKIEIGIGDSDKMSVVKKMFKCQSTEVISITTENRIFYLIGRDSKEVEEWATFLFTLCSEQQKQKIRSRSQSVPACLDELDITSITKMDQCLGTKYEDIATSVHKQRPNSDPSPQETQKELHIYESPGKLLRRLRQLTNTSFEEQEEKEEYYASPSSILAEPDEVRMGEYSISENEKFSSSKEYMSMKDLISEMVEDKIKPKDANNQLVTLPQNQMDVQMAKPKPLEKTPKVFFLSVVQLSIILSKITDDNQLEQVDILLLQNNLESYLTLVEASGCICISQWKDPCRLGCIFHQGDHIVAVNDLHIKDMDEIFWFISRSRRKEVKLTINRLPDSEILHVPGCKCPQWHKRAVVSSMLLSV
ncbi:pleckstrin homology domain-containing family S member 1 isoform X1 [Protobothrops mucrosquamatus]|uniref:pleckstrin homology domain-containing family S member 1 isoform X1 n=1 Tax=Protobothrops mucrosquamatus TaxID=103944 RepID=UPI000775A7AF|nr:pleckstrin homology domain-containing family S member 1 isoform X1 [Protobothrops mucrosquamatus]XP_015676049.1 pleckstrin homology domain-containing family S member 1 isoform X1 [Protobothrops mucrosquamatus]XP_015676050.1 pleckstrin homology domain-containing family S member 1 isoform X1 [Protobothrops mucrosquamatus]XP_015676051.1 pleckstrin homology domain-containing family S member 1 isoform X1 [Protobothrops mucrosquamatus]